MFNEEGLQSAGGCAQRIPETRKITINVAFFIGLYLHTDNENCAFEARSH